MRASPLDELDHVVADLVKSPIESQTLHLESWT